MYLPLLFGWSALALAIVAWLALMPLRFALHGAADARYRRWLARVRVLTLLAPIVVLALHLIVMSAAVGAAPAVSRALAAGYTAPMYASVWATFIRVLLFVTGVVWLTGSLWMLGQLIRSFFAERALLRHSSVSPRALRDRLQVAGERIGITAHDVDLRVANVDSPMLVGRVTSTILVPTFAWAGDEAHADALLLHELAHVQRRDTWSNCWLILASVVYWWHPAVRRALEHARTEREFACDDLAATALGSRASLARALVGLADTRHREQSGLLRIAANAHPLLQRVQRLVQDASSTAANPRTSVPRVHAVSWAPHLIAAIACAIVCVAVAQLIRSNDNVGKAYARSWLAPSTVVTFSGRDNAGPFSVVMRRGRVESVTINAQEIPARQINARGDSVAVHNIAGERVMSLTIDPRGAIAWDARPAHTNSH